MPDNFYQVHNLQKEIGKLSCTVHYHAAHPIFEGHFPGQPVVPGVCTMDMIKDLLEAALDKKLMLRSTGQVKFLRLILPDVVPEVLLGWTETDKEYAVNANLKADGADLFKMNAVFEVL
jgi:3-hydroxyacyl-[acyl-carrier-protein] dehydratase